ncbi:hypothetical protein C8J57DRAFT_340121 [Mycena rebaudengoi]|nr:hypothetical protein C8J57DRAFT_340121 [Mycena rebaudengoi]
MRDSSISGPIPMVLFPTVSALTIFGPHRDDKMFRFARRLANKSNLPVITRSSTDDPMIKFKDLIEREKRQAFEETFPVDPVVIMHARVDGINNEVAANNGQGENNPHHNEDDLGPPGDGHDKHYPNHNEDGRRPPAGDAGDPDGDGDGPGADGKDGKDWASPIHRTQVIVDLKLRDSNDLVRIEITSQTQFKTFPARTELPNPGKKEGMERRQAEAHTWLDVQCNPEEVLPQPSFAVLGLLSHRPSSIFSYNHLDTGFSEPSRIYKRGLDKNVQKTLGVSSGFAGAGHLATFLVNMSHTDGKTQKVEAQDDKVMPSVHVDPKRGDTNDDNGKSYRSYNYSYEAWRDPVDGNAPALSPLSVGFAFGIDFWNTHGKVGNILLLIVPRICIIIPCRNP